MEFKYNIKKDEDLDSLFEQFVLGREPNQSEVIEILKEENGSVSIAANKAGWEYLAKACLEMSFLSEVDNTHHVHRNQFMSFSDDSAKDALSLFSLNPEQADEVIIKRDKS